MAAFRKAKAEQASIKMGLYGPSGSGKTFTTLLLAEGLAKVTGKRVAFVDTERGTDFYAQRVPSRQIHPEAFDFDALYSRSITEVESGLRALRPEDHGVVVIDSITHLWEAARNAYDGRVTKAGTIPFNAWGKIKKPYKTLMEFLLNSPFHVFILGRQGNEFDEDEETGEMKKVGVKMKAEGETPYEPHILARMESVRNTKSGEIVVTCVFEKDRTGVLAGKTITWPTFDTVIKPLLPLLGKTQGAMMTADSAAATDAETLGQRDLEREAQSQITLEEYKARLSLAKTKDEVHNIGKEITPEMKSGMLSGHVSELREAYLAAEKRVK